MHSSEFSKSLYSNIKCKYASVDLQCKPSSVLTIALVSGRPDRINEKFTRPGLHCKPGETYSEEKFLLHDHNSQ